METSSGARASRTPQPTITCTTCGRRHEQVSYLELCGRCLYAIHGPGGYQRHAGIRRPLTPRQEADRQQRADEIALTNLLLWAATTGYANGQVQANGHGPSDGGCTCG